MHYRRLLNTRSWREIPGCPGRHVRACPDEELDGWVRAFATPFPDAAAEDEVLLWLLGGGDAVLSYRKPDGRLVHTLNTDEGLRRKCNQLGIDLEGWIRRRNELTSCDHAGWEIVLTAAGPDRPWALRLIRRHFPDLPVADAVAKLDALPLRFPELPRDRVMALLREIEAHGGEATLG